MIMFVRLISFCITVPFLLCFIGGISSASAPLLVTTDSCTLPLSWSGLWSNEQLNKDLYLQQSDTGSFSSRTSASEDAAYFLKLIDERRFLNKGTCVNNKDERYFFYDKNEKCFRCLFIIQRHFNVLQYRETHCDEEMTNFEELCDLLTPDLPLLTMIREDSMSEKCPLTESYQLLSNKITSNSASGSNNQRSIKNKQDILDYEQQILSSPSSKSINKCFKKPEQNVINKCVDQTLLRLDFQDCVNLNSQQANNLNNEKQKPKSAQSQRLVGSSLPINQAKINPNLSNSKKKSADNDTDPDHGVVMSCIAHWSEGNLNYLIIKHNKHHHHQHHQHHGRHSNLKVSTRVNSAYENINNNYKCIVYKDLDRPFKNTNNNNIINPTNNLIQLSMSENELCRDFYSSSDGPGSFTLEKIKSQTLKSNSKLINKKNVAKNSNQDYCKYPKILNKKWKNLKQTKYAFNINSNQIHINSINKINKTSSSSSSTLWSPLSAEEIIYLKLNCIRSLTSPTTISGDTPLDAARSKDKSNDPADSSTLDYLYLVNNLLECTSKLHCLSITFKSEFILHIKYGNYEDKKCLFNNKNLIYEDFLFIETDYGVNCPLSNRVYQLSDDKDDKELLKYHRDKRENLQQESQFSSIFSSNQMNQDCEHFLKIGCSSNDYTIYKKCQYNQEMFGSQTAVQNSKKKSRIRRENGEQSNNINYYYSYLQSNENTQAGVGADSTPVIESETNRICLAYWKVLKKDSINDYEYSDSSQEKNYQELDPNINYDESYVVLTKSANSETFSITCSIWQTFKNNNKLKIIDDNESLSLCSAINRIGKENQEGLVNQGSTQGQHHGHLGSYNQHQYHTINKNIINNPGYVRSNEYAVSTASALAILSPNSKKSDEYSVLFEYAGTCNSNAKNNAYNSVSIRVMPTLSIIITVSILAAFFFDQQKSLSDYISNTNLIINSENFTSLVNQVMSMGIRIVDGC